MLVAWKSKAQVPSIHQEHQVVAHEVVERLVDSLRPRAQAWQRQQVMREIPALLNDLREGFASVSFDVRKTDHLLKELQKCHIAALRGMAMTPAAESSDDVMSDVDGLEP